MFEPKFIITSKILANIKRIAEITSGLNNRRFPKVVLLELAKRARALSSHSSTSIEGNPLPLTEVKKILKNRPEHIRDTEREVLNYNQALIELDKKIKFGATFDLTLLLQIQKTVTNGLIADFNSGKIRRASVFVNDPRKRQTVYWPPDHQDVHNLIKDLLDFIKKNRGKTDPLILAGIFHKQFVTIHPFIDGNGRTARLATKFLLAEMGINTFNLFSFENYYNENVEKYFAGVGELGNYYDLKGKMDFSSWLEYFTDGIIDELLRVSGELEKMAVPATEELKDYHNKLLDFIMTRGRITDSDYVKLTSRAKATRIKDFKKLLDLKLIERHGQGRATFYKLKEK
ncbi:MAG: Fic family protein [Candidatus Uhrbacteria bacterium]